jgi:serine protease AprX
MNPQPQFSFPKHHSGADIAGGGKVCPVCSREIEDQFISITALDESLARLVRANAPDSREVDTICLRCKGLFERAKDHIVKEAAVSKDGSHVLSTPLRLDADERFTGRGITIAFLDSGFYPHDDLTQPRNRIVGYRNLAHKEGDETSLYESDVSSWHGMMTSVVAAGNGYLSNGFYSGIASDSEVALVKLARTGRITEQNIQDGLEWVLANKAKYNIRVVNISAGGDFEQSYLHDPLSQTVELCVREGLNVICAVGNAGHAPGHPVYPPASSPSAITVGGLDDRNSINRAKRGMYRSSYGPTLDGFQKPELIAPSIWVPAPILPNTPTAKEAEVLHLLDNAPDEELYAIIRDNPGVVKELDEALDQPIHFLRQIIYLQRSEEAVITGDYKYVDGTSFAAPIVSSVVACMLEANPGLTPQQVKRILIYTAERLPHFKVDRQGWGVINPRAAIEAALTQT